MQHAKFTHLDGREGKPCIVVYRKSRTLLFQKMNMSVGIMGKIFFLRSPEIICWISGEIIIVVVLSEVGGSTTQQMIKMSSQKSQENYIFDDFEV